MNAFFFHYGNHSQANVQQASVSQGWQPTHHYKKQCLIVSNVVCNVATRGRINKRQPRFVVCGKAKSIVVSGGVAIIS